MKRGVATITIYVYGETNEDLKNKAMEIIKDPRRFEDGSHPALEQLHEVEFGKIGSAKEIKL